MSAIVAAFAAQEIQARDDAVARVGVQFGKGKILQLILHFLDADALGQRRINFQRFARDAAALFGVFQMMQRAHIVQPVRQLDQQHADIFRHREDQFAEIFRLLGLIGLQFDARQLGDAVNQPRDAGAELFLDILERGERILDRIMQQAVAIVVLSIFMSVRMPATSSGCEKYGSPDARFCVPCACIEKT